MCLCTHDLEERVSAKRETDGSNEGPRVCLQFCSLFSTCSCQFQYNLNLSISFYYASSPPPELGKYLKVCRSCHSENKLKMKNQNAEAAHYDWQGVAPMLSAVLKASTKTCTPPWFWSNKQDVADKKRSIERLNVGSIYAGLQ